VGPNSYGGKNSFRASTIVETIIAFGLLAAGFAIFARLMVFGLRGMDQGEDAVRATGLARSELTRLRTEAKQNRWSALLAEDGSVRNVDGYEIALEVFERDIHSPSTAWETPHLGTGDARQLFDSQSCQAQAVVRVRGHGAETVLATLLHRPRLALGSPAIEVDNLPGSLSANGTATLRASLVSDDGDEIPSLFRWTVLPGTGNATIEPSRNGRDAVLRNSIETPFGTTITAPGRCFLRVSTVYFGEEITSPDMAVDLGS